MSVEVISKLRELILAGSNGRRAAAARLQAD